MSINLLDLVKDQVSGQLATQASAFLGESESSISQALGGVMPALLGGAINKASTDSGAQGMLDMIGKLDVTSLGNMAGIFGGGSGSINGLLNSGNGILESLLGSKTAGIADFIANMAGLKSSSSSSLLKMAAPFLMNIIGKQVAGKGPGFLKELILGQKSAVAAALPSGLGNILGFADLLGKGGEAIKTNIPTTSMPELKASGSGILKWLIPGIVALGAVWFFAKNGCGKQIEETGMEAIEASEEMNDDAMEVATEISAKTKTLFSEIDNEAKMAFDKLSLEAGSASDQIRKYMDADFNGIPMFLIKNVNFESGTSKLSPEAQGEVDNLAALLKAYPSVKLEINGYTDNTGDAEANKILSEARAASVMGRLIADGISAQRLKAFGFGQEHAIADNATEEGRVKNRRIELKIVQ